jgi:hypothetical protein
MFRVGRGGDMSKNYPEAKEMARITLAIKHIYR